MIGKKILALCKLLSLRSRFPRGVLLGILGEVCRTVLQILTRFQTIKCNFPHPFSDQTSKIHIVFRPDLRQKLCYIRAQTKYSSSPFRIPIFFFLSYSFGIETIKTFIQLRSSLKNHTRFQTKMSKVYTRFQTKTAQKTLPDGGGGGTYLCTLYNRVPPSRRPILELRRYQTLKAAGRSVGKADNFVRCYHELMIVMILPTAAER